MKGKRLSVGDLEQMTTHELADLLGNITLVLRHMPNVLVEQLQLVERPVGNADLIAANVRQDTQPRRENLPDWLAEEEE